MTAALYTILALAVFLPVVAGLATAAAAALDAVSPVRADLMAEEELPGAATLVILLARSESVLTSLRLVRFAGVASSVGLVAVIVLDRAGVGWSAVVLGVYALSIYPLVEIVPRGWAARCPDQAARRVAPAAMILHRFAPIRWVAALLEILFGRFVPAGGAGTVVSEDELIALTEEAAAGDEIDDEERELIESVFALGDTVVREVMVPRTDMVTVSVHATISEVLDLALERGLSRIPVTGDDVDDIVGVSFVKDLTRTERREKGEQGGQMVGTLMRRARFVPETKHADDLLRQMQAGEHHMAIVVDEYGGTAGLVTLEDLVEELVGEIVDEFDHEEPIWETLAGGDVRVHGRMPVDQLNHLVDAQLPEGDWDTVGGLIFDSLGRVPEVGAVMEAGGLRLVVEMMEGRRITRVRLTPCDRVKIEIEIEEDQRP